MRGSLSNRPFERFLLWWGGELAACIPGGLRQALAPRGRSLSIILGKAGTDLGLKGKGAAAEIFATIPTGNPEERRSAARIATKSLGKVSRCTLHLDPRHVLVKRMRLPEAASATLREVVGYEIERHTPFAGDAVYFHAAVERTFPDAQRIEAVVTLVPKSLVTEAIAETATWGLRVDRVEAPTETGVVRLAVPRIRHRQPGLKGAVTVLSLCAILLAAGSIGIPLWKKQQYLESLQARVPGALAKARAANVLAEQIDGRRTDLNFLREELARFPPRSLLLDELTRRLPDNCYLTRLSVNEGKVRLNGLVSAASEVIRVLEASPLLRGAAFDSPVVRDRQTDKDRFSISADIRGGGS